MKHKSFHAKLGKLRRFLPYWVASTLVLIPLLRWYGPPQPVWNVSFQQGNHFNSPKPGEIIAGLSRNGRVIWTRIGWDGPCRFWDAANGARLKGEANPSLRQRTAVALSDDGERFAFLGGEGFGSQLVVVSTRSGKELVRHPLQPQRFVRQEWLDAAQDWSCGSLSFSPDSSHLAVDGNCFGFRIGTTQVFRLDQPTEAYGQSIENRNGGDLLSFSLDGQSLLHRSNRENQQTFGTTHPPAWEWIDLATGRKRAVPQSHCQGAMGAWFLEEDQTIVGNSTGLSRELIGPSETPKSCQSAQLWDAVTTEIIGLFSNEEVIEFPEDRRTFWTKHGQDHTRMTRIRDSTTGTLIAEWPSRELDLGGRLIPLNHPTRKAVIVSSQSLFKDLDNQRYQELKRRRSWWSLIWIYRSQVNVFDAETGALLRAVPGWGNSQLTPDGTLLITQTDEAGWIPRKYWFPWRWTMSAYLVNAAMPWTTAAWWGLLLAAPLGWLSSRVARPKPSDNGEGVLVGTPVEQRACPACGKLSPSRMSNCYHCGKNISDAAQEAEK